MEQVDWESVWNRIVLWSTNQGVKLLLILIVATIALYATKILGQRLYDVLIWRHADNVEIQKRARTLTSFIRYTLVTTICAVAVMMLLAQVGMEIRPILAGAGVVGLAIGFGAQTLVQDVISGVFILLEDQVRVGDVVNLKGKGGLVEKINLRTIQLRDLDGAVHFVRNGQVDIITNMTKDFSNYVIEIGVAYGTNTDRVLQIFREIDEEMRQNSPFSKDILKPLDVYGIERFGDSAIILRARTTTKPLRQWDVGREFNRRIKQRFEQEKIEIPFPQQTLHIDQSTAQLLAILADERLAKSSAPAPQPETR